MSLIDKSVSLINRLLPLIYKSLVLFNRDNGITETTNADENDFILN